MSLITIMVILPSLALVAMVTAVIVIIVMCSIALINAITRISFMTTIVFYCHGLDDFVWSINTIVTAVTASHMGAGTTINTNLIVSTYTTPIAVVAIIASIVSCMRALTHLLLL